MTNAIRPNTDNQLLDDIKNSLFDMQQQMQNTYSHLADIKLAGESHDKTVKVTMTATYSDFDIEFDARALQGGVKEFKWRIREAWKNLLEAVQKTTQNKTMELLQSMQIPEDIKNMSLENAVARAASEGDGDTQK
ncbi:MAG: hypothetical protein A3F41_05500 [Coxiella sp. RIFCSPHIGHO2_12_FULL_44_14]|nr:MAG: hypothetical protein A3F41_05500 [Coxiella sp. RIFCSPHIGHO2_12_FULL_44_14]